MAREKKAKTSDKVYIYGKNALIEALTHAPQVLKRVHVAHELADQRLRQLLKERNVPTQIMDAVEAKRALATGKRIFEILTQSPTDTFSLMAQQLMFDIVLNLGDGEELDLNALKLNAPKSAAQVTKDEEYEAVRDQLKTLCLVELKGVPTPTPAPAQQPQAPVAPPPAGTQVQPEPAEADKQAAGAAK